MPTFKRGYFCKCPLDTWFDKSMISIQVGRTHQVVNFVFCFFHEVNFNFKASLGSPK